MDTKTTEEPANRPAKRSTLKLKPVEADPPSNQDLAIRSETFDLDAPECYLNRELTWLGFNRRLLHEAADERTPLLERVKFLAIVHSNLDEFFMKRIGGLKQQIGAGLQAPSVDGRTPAEQIKECFVVVWDLARQMRQLASELFRLLEKEGIRITCFEALPSEEQAALRDHYRKNIFPLLTPLAIDPAHPFPLISNLSLNLLLTVRCLETGERTLVRIKVPTSAGVPRFIQVGHATGFVPLEDLMAKHLDWLFPGIAVESCELFRITRNAIAEKSEEQADDLLALIESELRDRKFAPSCVWRSLRA
ncbi:MAG: hypothetical protein ACREV4_07315 [Gammaproteobacteria bacterium]